MAENSQDKLKGLLIGCGYFAQFQLEAWTRVTGAELAAVCDADRDRASAAAEKFAVPNVYTDLNEALAAESYDFADVVTRPEGREVVLEALANAGIPILCQKPFAKDLDQARARVKLVEDHGVPLAINENFRHGPWYGKLLEEMNAGTLGTLHTARFEMRIADGLGPEPYSHQPYFVNMPRLLIHESLVHQMDIAHMLFGDFETIYARTRRINPAIIGEDWALIHAHMSSGIEVTIDATRVAPPREHNPTQGTVEVLGETGAAWIGPPGVLKVYTPKDTDPVTHEFDVSLGYRGDVCRLAQQHFIDRLRDGKPSDTSGRNYLKTIAAVEAAYLSAAENRVVRPGEL